MAELGSVLLAITIIASTYPVTLALTPPNPQLDKRSAEVKDRVNFLLDSVPFACRVIFNGLISYHAAVTALIQSSPPSPLLAQVCPNPENVNLKLFSWSTLTATSLILLYAGAIIRLLAYRELGRYFTFNLKTPEQLLKTGVYGWVQHPSYTGVVSLFLGFSFMFLRWDAAPGCWISDATSSHWHGWGLVPALALWVGLPALLVVRVRDEERLLKNRFGQQWEDWHRSTKRFIPFLI